VPHTISARIDRAMHECIEDCTTCHNVCLSTVTYCLEQGGRHAQAGHVTLLLDCADICRTSADFMLRGSGEHKRTCAACAALCHRCAEACAQFLDDRAMQECAGACRRCADSCENMAA
jgi:hypothetical protein